MSTKAETRKHEIIEQLIAARTKLLGAASALPVEKQDEVFLGIWSIKDLLAHLIGWDAANREAIEAVQAGRLPEFYAHHDKDWRTFNADLVARHKQDNMEALLASVRESHQRLRDMIEGLPAPIFDKDFAVRFKGYKVTIARLLQAETADENTHFDQIQTFAGTS